MPSPRPIFPHQFDADGFATKGTVYINLDAFWNDNFSNTELQDFVNHCHGNGQKAGYLFRTVRLVRFDKRCLVVVG